MADVESGGNGSKDKKKNSKGSDLGSSVIPMAFSIAGLCLTLNGQFRGDKQSMINAFGVVIGISAAEICLAFIVCCCCLRAVCSGRGICSMLCATILSTTATIVGSVIGFALLVVALVSAEEVPYSDEAGCANGYGCANIMAIIAAVFYGARTLVVAIGVLCCYCCCAVCCLKGRK